MQILPDLLFNSFIKAVKNIVRYQASITVKDYICRLRPVSCMFHQEKFPAVYNDTVIGKPASFFPFDMEVCRIIGDQYVWGGSSPSTSFDCSGFVSWVINNCGNGWNIGRQTIPKQRKLTPNIETVRLPFLFII